MLRLAKKFLSLLTSAIFVLILSGFISLEPIARDGVAYAQELSPTCTDITLTGARKTTDPTPNNPQAGTLDFNLPNEQSKQACLEDEETTRTLNTVNGNQAITANFFRGFVWNTNIGYVSMSCNNGENSGQACGDINYGASLFVNQQNNATVMGFAWTDTAGWISMGCQNRENNGVSCGDYNYGVRMVTQDRMHVDGCNGSEKNGDLVLGDLYGYGWNDSLGWINFCGSHIEVESVENVSNKPIDATIIDTRIPGISQPTIADGFASYNIVINITQNGKRIPANKKRITITPGIAVNTIRDDQIIPCLGEACNGDAVQISDFQPVDDFELNGSVLAGAYVAQMTSTAPSGPGNSFILRDLQVHIEDLGSHETQDIVVPFGRNGQEFIFAAPATITRIGTPSANNQGPSESYITAIPDTTQNIAAEVSSLQSERLPLDQINISMQLYDCSFDYNFSIDDGREQVFEEGVFPYVTVPNFCLNDGEGLVDMRTGTAQDAMSNKNKIILPIHTGVPEGQDAPPGIEATNALGVQTIIYYTIARGNEVKDVRYYGLAVQDSSVLNQTAEITGNLRLDIVDASGNDALDRIGQSIAERAQLKREPFYRAIKNVLGRRQPDTLDPPNPEIAGDIKVLSEVDLNTNKEIFYFKPRRQPNQGAREACAVIIKSTQTGLREFEPINFRGNKTIVAEGCNVFIDSNIVAPQGRLGIIALEGFDIIDGNTGGNVYICNRVTDVEANFVLDNTLYSYVADMSDCGGRNKRPFLDYVGTPVWGRNARRALGNQLTIVGSLLSNNTIGGAKVGKLGDGGIASNSVEDEQKSQMQDLNYLRISRTVTEDFNLCWANDIRLSNYFRTPANSKNTDPEVCSSNNPATHGIVNIIFREPMNNQPIFKSAR